MENDHLLEKPKTKKKKAIPEIKLDPNFLTHENKPRNRTECANIPRPCPYVSCRYHLYLDVFEGGVLKINHGEEFDDDTTVIENLKRMPYSCSLDAADQGEMELDQIADSFNLTRERIRQILETGFRKIRDNVGDEVVKILFSFHEPD